MRSTILALATVCAFLTLARTGESALLVAEASLDGASENPGNASPGTGFAQIFLDTDLHTLLIKISFQDLSAPTTVAHIHAPVSPPGNVGVAVTPGTLPGFPVGVTSGVYEVLLDTLAASTYTATFLNGAGGGTTAGAEAALFEAIRDVQAYVNIHTTTFPAGEIRGFLQPVPEPTSIALLGCGLLGLAVLGRRVRSSAGTVATARD